MPDLTDEEIRERMAEIEHLECQFRDGWLWIRQGHGWRGWKHYNPLRPEEAGRLYEKYKESVMIWFCDEDQLWHGEAPKVELYFTETDMMRALNLSILGTEGKITLKEYMDYREYQRSVIAAQGER